MRTLRRRQAKQLSQDLARVCSHSHYTVSGRARNAKDRGWQTSRPQTVSPFTLLAVGPGALSHFSAPAFTVRTWKCQSPPSSGYVSLAVQSCLCDPIKWSPPGCSARGDSPGKNTAVGCHALLQGIFPTQGLNPGLRHCGQIF